MDRMDGIFAFLATQIFFDEMIELFLGLMGLMGVYLGIGLLFSVPFVLKGAAAIDEGAKQGNWLFQVLIVPGTAVFWPLLLKRWVKGEQLPEERSEHR